MALRLLEEPVEEKSQKSNLRLLEEPIDKKISVPEPQQPSLFAPPGTMKEFGKLMASPFTAGIEQQKEIYEELAKRIEEKPIIMTEEEALKGLTPERRKEAFERDKMAILGFLSPVLVPWERLIQTTKAGVKAYQEYPELISQAEGLTALDIEKERQKAIMDTMAKAYRGEAIVSGKDIVKNMGAQLDNPEWQLRNPIRHLGAEFLSAWFDSFGTDPLYLISTARTIPYARKVALFNQLSEEVGGKLAPMLQAEGLTFEKAILDPKLTKKLVENEAKGWLGQQIFKAGGLKNITEDELKNAIKTVRGMEYKPSIIKPKIEAPKVVADVKPPTEVIIPPKPEIKPVLALELKNGVIIRDEIAKTHADILINKNIAPEDVFDVGIIGEKGKYIARKAPDWIAVDKPTSVTPQPSAKSELRLLAEPEEMAPAPEEKIQPPEKTEIVPTPTAKEPWQMTREEFVKIGTTKPARDMREIAHENFIRQALSEGESVLPEILKDYPELMKEAKPIPPELEPLEQEARKYESAEEFVRSYPEIFDNLMEKGVIGREAKYGSYEVGQAMIKSFGTGKQGLTDFYNQAVKGIKPEIKPPLEKYTIEEYKKVLAGDYNTRYIDKKGNWWQLKFNGKFVKSKKMPIKKVYGIEKLKIEDEGIYGKRATKIEKIEPAPSAEKEFDISQAKGYTVSEGQSIYYEVRDKIPRGTVPSESGKAQIHSFISSSPLKLKFKKQGYFSFPKEKVSSPADAAFAFQQLKNEAVERFYIIGLKDDTPIFIEPLSIGIIDRAPVSPYEALPLLASKKADSFYLIHNHPGGNINPSSDDIASSKAFKEALKTVNIQFKGHIVIDDTKFGFIEPDTFYNTVIEHLPPQEATQKVTVYSKYIEWATSVEELTKLSGPEAIFDFVKSLNIDWKDNALVLYANNNLKITGSELLPIKKITGKELAKSATSVRAINIFLVNSKLTAIDLYAIQDDLDPFSITLLDQVDFQGPDTFVSANAEGLLAPKRVKESKFIKEVPKIPEGMTEEEYYGKSYIPEEIKKEIDAINSEYKKSLFDAIIASGGIRISPGIKEEMQGIPLRLLRKDGMYPDDMATELAAYGFRFEGADDLIAQIKQIETFVRGSAKTPKARRIQVESIIKTITKPTEFYEWPEEMGKPTAGIEQEAFPETIPPVLIGKPYSPITEKLATQAQKALVHILAAEKKLSPTQLHKLEKIYIGKRTMAGPKTELEKAQMAQKGKKPMTQEEAAKLIEVLKGISTGRGERPPKIPRTTDIIPAEFAKREIGKPGLSQIFFEPWYIFKRIGVWDEVGKPIYDAVDNFENNFQKQINTYLKPWLTKVGKSKEASRRMWEYADGSISAEDLAKMTPAEKEVAEEWKALAEVYADRLGIPYDERNPNYISHIIEDTFREYIKSDQFPEDLAAVLENIHTKEIFDPFLQRRLGFPIVKKDFWNSAFAYIRAAERKLAFDPALNQVNAFINRAEGKRLLPAETIKYIEGVLKYQLLGRPMPLEKFTKTTLEHIAGIFGKKKVQLPKEIAEEVGVETIEAPRVIAPSRPATMAISKAKELSYLSLIGGNLRTMIINLTQPVGTLAKLKGWPWQTVTDMGYGYLKTIENIFKPSFWNKMREVGLIQDVTTFLEGLEPQHRIIGMHIKDLLFWNMKISEFVNRVASGFAGARNKVKWGDTKRLAEVLPGLGKKAILLDKELSDLINFRYGALYRPTFTLDPIGQIAYHLNSFNAKHLQLLHQLAKDMDTGRWGKNWREDFKKNPYSFIKQLSTDDRGAFLRYLLYASLLSLSLGMGAGLLKGKGSIMDVRFGENPLWKTFIHLITLNIEELKKDIPKFIPYRGAVQRIEKIEEEGIKGLVSTGKPKKSEKEERLETIKSLKTL